MANLLLYAPLECLFYKKLCIDPAYKTQYNAYMASIIFKKAGFYIPYMRYIYIAAKPENLFIYYKEIFKLI